MHLDTPRAVVSGSIIVAMAIIAASQLPTVGRFSLAGGMEK
jgi:hypothetical protein